MWAAIFFFLMLVSLGVAATFLILFLESKQIGRHVIRKWRIAIAGRRDLIKTRRALEAADKQARKRSQDADALAQRLIADDHAAIIEIVSSKNYHRKTDGFRELLTFVAQHGTPVPPEEEALLWKEIKDKYNLVRKIEEDKAKQAEMRAQAREEEKERRDRERAIQEADRLTEIKQRALEDAIRLLGDTRSEEIDRLRAELAEAQAAAERTKSQAELTKEGNVYVISNIGSFGKDVFKIGLTRRHVPEDRVNELGDASVPFSFDIHAMIRAKDAPALEAAIHRELSVYRVNKVNYRKEFFRTDLTTIVQAFRRHHDAEIEYVIDPEAAEYYESIQIAKVIEKSPGSVDAQENLATVQSLHSNPSGDQSE